MDYELFLIITSLTGVICQHVTPLKNEKTSSADSSVSLSCNYSKGAADYFFWYRQHPGKPPEFLTFNTEVEETQKESQSRLSGRVRKKETQMDLLISSAAVTDSAVYYCAVRPTQTGFNKIQFGSGSKLSVEQKEPIEPDYYDLGPNGDGTRVCLATGFTRLKATLMKPGFQNQSASQITGHNGEPTGFYSQVAFQKDGEKCENEEQGEGNITKPDQCDAELEPDEMVNLASITIFGLRIIFIKTVAFNVLMTLRLWTSQ